MNRSEYLKDYYQKNKERLLTKMSVRYQTKKDHILNNQKVYLSNPEVQEKRKKYYIEKSEQQKAYHEKYYKKISSKKRSYNRYKKYGISQIEYDKMFIDQDGKCLGCTKHQSELTRELCVDHCHKSGKIRGLLCYKCNLAIGFVEDDIDTMNNLIKYLSKH